MAKQSLSYYVERYQNGTLTEAEAAVLLELLQHEEYEADLDLLMIDDIKQWEQSEAVFPEVKKRIKASLKKQIEIERSSVKQLAVRKARWYWAAASVLLLLSLGVYYYKENNKSQDHTVTSSIENIVAPVTNRATITLADGSQVYLDSAGNGQLGQVGNIRLVKLANGQIAYQTAEGQILKELQYNTLSNPRGSKVIDIILSDGSHVWLNAGSSIRYPVAFVGANRTVELEGEGYFEVTKDPARKFVVMANGTATEVLGTHFNINAYPDEAAVRTTLFEGAVKVLNSGREKLLNPGQQSVAAGDILEVTKNVNMEEVIAWKEGLFLFENKDVGSIMNLLSQWYDIEVEYRGNKVTELFTAAISRDAPLSKVLGFLEKTGRIHFTVEGKKVIVKP
ncbi:FecR family protein [Niabella sp. CJ426]|uniref:FecR family protein n=1 Tax=Niabella sp. CJ426 TaxID=3393740 RepID=UPI003CFFF19A